MYGNTCDAPQMGKRMTEAEKIMNQSRELISYAESVAKLSEEKLTKIINDGPRATCGDVAKGPDREHFAPYWADLNDNLDRVRIILRHIESRLAEAEI